MHKEMIQLFQSYNNEEKILDNITKVIQSGITGEGDQVGILKSKLVKLFGTDYVTMTNSCTSALTLALRLVGLKPGDNVISSPFTMIATNCAIANFGANIIWSDIEEKTLCMGTNYIPLIMEYNPKAIVVTAVGGLVPADIESFIEIRKQTGIKFILDCAHGLMTRYKGKHICHYFDYTCFSFQSIKHLSTGDGGALVCNDIDGNISPYIKAEDLKWFGITRRVPKGKTKLQHQMESDVPNWGYKFHMNNIAAAIGLANFDDALENVKKSQANSEFLWSAIVGDSTIQRVNNNIKVLEPNQTWNDPENSWWCFGLIVYNRSALIKHLEENGIVSSPMWKRNDKYSCFRKFSKLSNNPSRVLNTIEDDILFIPNGWWLERSDLEHIADSVISFYKHSY